MKFGEVLVQFWFTFTVRKCALAEAMGLKNFGFIADTFVSNVREKFLRDVYEPTPELFDEEDIDQIKAKDWMIKRFLILAYKNEEEAVRLLSEAMQWRKETNVRHVKDTYFPKEFFESGSLFTYEHDKDGLPTLMMRVKYVKRFPELLDDYRKFMRHLIFRIDEQSQGNGWMLLMDFTDCGYGAYENIDLLHYFVTTLHYYYPAGMDYVLAIDLPWVLKTCWTVVKYWIPEKRRGMVRFCGKDGLEEFFDYDALPPPLGGTSTKQWIVSPEYCPSALEFGIGTLGLDRDRLDTIISEYEPLLEEARNEAALNNN